MRTAEKIKTGTLRLALYERVDINYLNMAASLIREMPCVLSVRVHVVQRQLEISYKLPTEGLLQRVHLALQAAGTELAALRS